MLDDRELINHFVRKGMNKKIPHLKLGHGLDFENIKGYKDFPLYEETNGFISHAKKNTDEYLMNNREMFKGLKAQPVKHTPLPSGLDHINSNYDNSKPWKTLTDTKFMNRYLGIPLSWSAGTIVLENPTAKSMGADKMTQDEFMVKTWQYQAGGNNTDDTNDFFTKFHNAQNRKAAADKNIATESKILRGYGESAKQKAVEAEAESEASPSATTPTQIKASPAFVSPSHSRSSSPDRESTPLRESESESESEAAATERKKREKKYVQPSEIQDRLSEFLDRNTVYHRSKISFTREQFDQANAVALEFGYSPLSKRIKTSFGIRYHFSQEKNKIAQTPLTKGNKKGLFTPFEKVG